MGVWTKEIEVFFSTAFFLLLFFNKNWTALSRETKQYEQQHLTATRAGLFDACSKVFGLKGQNGYTTLSTHVFNLFKFTHLTPSETGGCSS